MQKFWKERAAEEYEERVEVARAWRRYPVISA